MEALLVVLRLISGVVVLDVLFSQLFPARSMPRLFTQQLTAPLYRPVQSVFDPARLGVDFSPMVVVMLVLTMAFVLAPDVVGGR